MRVLALATDLYGISGGIAEYNRFFIRALSEIENVTKVVVLARHSRSSTKAFEDDRLPTEAATTLSLPPRKGEDDRLPTEAAATLSLPPRKGEDDRLPTEAATSLSLSPRKGEDDRLPTETTTSCHSRGGGNQQAFRPSIEICEDDKRVTVLKESRNKWQYALRAMTALIIQGPFDVIWCGHIYMLPLAHGLAWMGRAKLWIQIHGIEAWQKPSQCVDRCVSRADRVLAVSRYTRRKFLAWAKLAPEKVKVHPDTFDAQRFFQGERNLSLRKKWDAVDKKVLLTVGRLAAGEMYKGHDAVIRVLPELLKKDPAWVYWIAGDGCDRARLEALVREAGVQEQVKFLGFVQEENLADLYRSANVFIMLSKGEGFGIVYLEAMACGLPVVAGNQDASMDPLLDGCAGNLVNPNNDAEIIAAIRHEGAAHSKQSVAPEIFSYSHFAEQIDRLMK